MVDNGRSTLDYQSSGHRRHTLEGGHAYVDPRRPTPVGGARKSGGGDPAVGLVILRAEAVAGADAP